MPRPKTHDENLRVRLLDRAGELLSAEGPAALSLRRLASECDTSTTAVYSLFGGKPGLVRELYLEAFQRFGDRLSAVPATDDPVEDLVQLGLAYRAGALSDPHLYAVLFNQVIPGFVPDPEAATQVRGTFAPLLAAASRGVAEGVLADQPPQEIALAAWANAHGLVSLELTAPTLLGSAGVEQMYETALRAHVNGWRRR
ncbi:TetR/AcrR family transcriptional regulator [Goodfellowiella coeruleoviolacea]|uniref:Transcriptional regulator, TetR family n=1 Tax=Goodfellowiella coeruleoviolacea TaxID=334858 RepID=A0AAE3GG07_9PSEU|nr:TetR/AcrR family transcriptional regulator [Goodfellowiella coeruleoviolacea]MCP2165463.1 transcriptional regulator, TetR family [Goodfellowiella coeruleoviolacea]